MTPQERDLITTLLARLKSAAPAGQAKDPEADQLIRQAMAEQPDAPYYLVQTVLIQDLSLHQAQNRIAELEHQVADASAQKSTGSSFLGGLFGHREAPPPAPVQPPAQPGGGPWGRASQQPGPGYDRPGYPQPGYAQPGYAPPPYQQQGGGFMGSGGGGGFLRSAAATAAGVAGGALLFQGISSLFGHHYASGLYGGLGGYNPGLGETVVNNYYGDEASGGDYGGGGDAGSDFGGDTGGGGDYGGGGDFGGGGDYGGGGDFGGGDDFGGGGDFGGGSDTSC